MVEQIINIERMDHALTLFGSRDENIRQVEATYGVTVVFRGTDIKVTGEAEAVMNAVRQAIAYTKSGMIDAVSENIAYMTVE